MYLIQSQGILLPFLAKIAIFLGYFANLDGMLLKNFVLSQKKTIKNNHIC